MCVYKLPIIGKHLAQKCLALAKLLVAFGGLLFWLTLYMPACKLTAILYMSQL